MQVQLLLYVFLALLGKMDADKFEGSDGQFIGFLLSFLTLFLTISAFILVNIIIYYDQHGNQVVLAQLNRTAAKKSKQEQARDRLKSAGVAASFARNQGSKTASQDQAIAATHASPATRVGDIELSDLRTAQGPESSQRVQSFRNVFGELRDEELGQGGGGEAQRGGRGRRGTGLSTGRGRGRGVGRGGVVGPQSTQSNSFTDMLNRVKQHPSLADVPEVWENRARARDSVAIAAAAAATAARGGGGGAGAGRGRGGRAGGRRGGVPTGRGGVATGRSSSSVRMDSSTATGTPPSNNSSVAPVPEDAKDRLSYGKLMGELVSDHDHRSQL